MLDVNLLGQMLLEEQYPILTDEQLTMLATTYTNIYQACYVGCLMKSSSEDITLGPITIKSDKTFWKNLADSFYLQWQLDPNKNGTGNSRSLTGKVIGRADEF